MIDFPVQIYAPIRGHVIIISGNGAAACALRPFLRGVTWNATVRRPAGNIVYPKKRSSFVHKCRWKC